MVMEHHVSLLLTGSVIMTQGMIVYMNWVPGILGIGRLPHFLPKPFTSAVNIQSTAKVLSLTWTRMTFLI